MIPAITLLNVNGRTSGDEKEVAKKLDNNQKKSKRKGGSKKIDMSWIFFFVSSYALSGKEEARQANEMGGSSL